MRERARAAQNPVPAHIRVLRRALLDDDDKCWEFEGAHTRKGYPIVQLRHGVTGRAHRVVYEAMVGPIPEALTIDHLCQNTGCVNPAHMEPVTVEENIRRARVA